MHLSFHTLMHTALGAALAAGAASAQVVINEVAYDAPGSDDGQVFVELFGPTGFDISGWTLQSVEGGGSSPGTNNNESFTFPPGTLIGASGLVVVADEINGTGTTSVANATFIVGDMDLENGPDGLQLIDAAGALADAVAYGNVSATINSSNGLPFVETAPARDVFAPLSIERSPAGADSGDNSVDFTPNVPTPGVGTSCCKAIEWVNQGFGNSVSVGAGERVGLDFWFSCAANQPFLVLASISDPTLSPPPPPFPVFDPIVTPALLGLSTTPPFLAWSGTLGLRGESEGLTFLDFASTPLPVGTQFSLYVGAVALDPSLNLVGTNHVELIILP